MVAQTEAVLHGVGDQSDVVPVWYIVFSQDHPPEVVLPDIGGAAPEPELQLARECGLAGGTVTPKNHQSRQGRVHVGETINLVAT